MEGKECTCKFILGKVVMIAGVITGALLAVLGIISIAGDTNGLFSGTMVRWFVRDTPRVTFTDNKGLSSNDVWTRTFDQIKFEWTTQKPRFVMECDAKYVPLKNPGFRTKKTTNGNEIVTVENFTIDVHYFCVMNLDGVSCIGSASYQGRIRMYTGSIFRTNAVLGNQNFRFTIFIFSAICIAFGIVMILGELHVPLVVTKFTFFYYSFVKGLIYIAWGFPVMGLCNLFGLFTAIILWILGIVNCIMGWRTVTTFDWKKVGQRGTTAVVTRREYI